MILLRVTNTFLCLLFTFLFSCDLEVRFFFNTQNSIKYVEISEKVDQQCCLILVLFRDSLNCWRQCRVMYMSDCLLYTSRCV